MYTLCYIKYNILLKYVLWLLEEMTSYIQNLPCTVILQSAIVHEHDILNLGLGIVPGCISSVMFEKKWV